jgi:hypothetical protein
MRVVSFTKLQNCFRRGYGNGKMCASLGDMEVVSEFSTSYGILAPRCSPGRRVDTATSIGNLMKAPVSMTFVLTLKTHAIEQSLLYISAAMARMRDLNKE